MRPRFDSGLRPFCPSYGFRDVVELERAWGVVWIGSEIGATFWPNSPIKRGTCRHFLSREFIFELLERGQGQ